MNTNQQQEMIAAIKDASTPAERRQSLRIRRKVASQMTPWTVGVPAKPFAVLIEDISEIGVGIVHSDELKLGAHYLLLVPRCDGAVVIECIVVHCEPAGRKLYRIGLESIERIEHIQHTQAVMTITSRRTRLLFLLFGIVGLAVAALVPI